MQNHFDMHEAKLTAGRRLILACLPCLKRQQGKIAYTMARRGKQADIRMRRKLHTYCSTRH
eukprot:scaffold214635_cov17-Prasinocladus_malaysianus.AAC.1